MPEAAGSPRAAFLETAWQVGARLSRDAVRLDGRCNWLGADSARDGSRREVFRALGPGLYGGTAGIALFLTQLHRAVGEPLLEQTARGALAQALSRLEDVAPDVRSGLYSGWTGIGYAALEAGEALGDPELATQGLDLLARVGTLPESAGRVMDVVGGWAGAVLGLLAAHRRRPQRDLLPAAVRCGGRLLEAAERGEDGWSWATLPSTRPGAPHLTGFAHGAAGIALALAELSRATGEEELAQAAREGFRYEGRWLDPERGNWADLRDPPPGAPPGPSFMNAWCHGAAGIGLTRLRGWEILGDDFLRTDAEAALRTTLAELPSPGGTPASGSFSLCHGAAGNAELALEAARVLGAPGLAERAAAVGHAGIAAYGAPGLTWPSGLLSGRESPSLMLGLAGIGYFYLRLARPGTPSVLLLTPGGTDDG